MRVWQKIKVSDVVIYRDEKYIVLDIYKEDSSTYGIIKKIKDESIIHVMLNACSLDEN